VAPIEGSRTSQPEVGAPLVRRSVGVASRHVDMLMSFMDLETLLFWQVLYGRVVAKDAPRRAGRGVGSHQPKLR
jgi:hypothetical protein